MEVTDALLTKLAELSKLSFNEDEKTELKKDLQNMISFVDKLAEVDTSHVEPLLHISENKTALREDVVSEELNNDAALKNAEKSLPPYFAVPKVIKK
jgi:aspartyl-tRNA(Asn)/glutamyl-tRNA(Gln) amidotransferase subunit C